jgi:hypothetical protein
VKGPVRKLRKKAENAFAGARQPDGYLVLAITYQKAL